MPIVRKRCPRISRPQKAALLEFMKKYPRLLSGKFDRNFRHQDARNLWQALTKHIHTFPGARKTWMQWRKVWHDLRRPLFQYDKTLQSLYREVDASLKIEPRDDPIAVDPVETSDEDLQSFESHDLHLESVNSGDEPNGSNIKIPRRYTKNISPIVKLAEDLMKNFREHIKAEEEYRETHLKLIREQTDAIKSIAKNLEMLKK